MSKPINEYRFEVKVLLLQENNTWIAQGLEYDLTGHGSTIRAAMENFKRTFLGQAIVDLHHGEEPLASIPKAPQFYWDRFEEANFRGKGERFDLPEETVPEETPPAYMISALAAETRIYAA